MTFNISTTSSLQDKYKSPEISISEEFIDAEYCVFKLYYGEKYVVLMGKTLFRQVEIIRYNLAYYFKRGDHKIERKNKSDQDFCTDFYKYIHDNPGKDFRIEVVIEDPNPYKLLQSNQIELDKGFNNDDCLNINTQPELSKYIQMPALYRSGKYKNYKHWINRGYYLNFRKWQYNRPSKPKGAPL